VSKFEEIMTSSLQQTDKVESAHYFLTLTESSESYFPIFVVNIKEELYFCRKSKLISCQLCPEWLKNHDMHAVRVHFVSHLQYNVKYFVKLTVKTVCSVKLQ